MAFNVDIFTQFLYNSRHMNTEIEQTQEAGKGSSQELLPRIFASPLYSVSMLECLSRIEYAGVNWILGMPPELMNASMHHHAQDELHHSKMMADAARTGRKVLSADELKIENRMTEDALAATERYLTAIFRKYYRKSVSVAEGSTFSLWFYYSLSLAVERRLIRIYPHVASKGTTEALRTMVKKLIHDEKEHFNAMEDGVGKMGPGLVALIEEMQGVEEEAAKIWMSTLERIYS